MISTVAFVTDRMNARLVVDALAEDEARQLPVYSEILSRHFEAVVGDIRVLAHSVLLRDYLQNRDVESARRLAESFCILAEGTMLYDQVRFIDSDGIERVRVNFDESVARVVSEEELQDKSRRYYYADLIRMETGALYVSPFDLNVEHGEVEMPPKPMMRLGTPVDTPRGERAGILVLNFLGERVVEELAHASRGRPGSLMLLNNDGYWLYAEDASLPWGFMFPEGADLRFQNRYPVVWEWMIEGDGGRFETEDGVFLAKRVDPLSRVAGSAMHPNVKPASRSPAWWVVSHIERVSIESLLRPGRLRRQAVYLVALSVAFVVSVVLTRSLAKGKRYRRELEFAALYDPLTGLPNRRLFFDRLAVGRASAERHRCAMAVMFVDLDRFKVVNDTYGHDAGDELLVQTAQRLQAALRGVDTIARMGGDEFAVLLSEVDSRETALSVAAKLRSVLTEPFALVAATVSIDASIGVSCAHPGVEPDPDVLLKRADRAMYTVKRAGRGGVRLCEEE